MHNKLNSLEQVSNLHIGDIIKKFPNDYKPEEVFDDKRTRDIDTYKVRHIHAITGIVELSMTGNSIIMFASPVDIGHLYMKPSDFTQERVWWQ